MKLILYLLFIFNIYPQEFYDDLVKLSVTDKYYAMSQGKKLLIQLTSNKKNIYTLNVNSIIIDVEIIHDYLLVKLKDNNIFVMDILTGNLISWKRHNEGNSREESC